MGQTVARKDQPLVVVPADRLFAEPRPLAADFAFDRRTAEVFDDMVGRSVPYYEEIQRMVGELAADFAQPGTRLYDLGCSTGTTLARLDPLIAPDVAFIGIDNAPAMLAKARAKLEAAGLSRPLELICADFEDGPPLAEASVITIILTLQFVRPLQREALLRRLRRALQPGGCLILVEKLICAESTLNRLFIRHYYDLKRRNGYSATEIAQKREALENVLIPYREDENRELLRRAGFSQIEPFFRWYNFCGLLAVA